MKKMGQIRETQKSIEMTSVFRGYDHRDVIADGEMYQTANLSDDLSPVLSNRPQRMIHTITNGILDQGESSTIHAVHGREKLVYVIGKKVYYNKQVVQGISVSEDETMLPKKIVSMGAYVCIWPDKVYFNTTSLTDRGSMEQDNEMAANLLHLTPCTSDGSDIDLTNVSINSNAPSNPTNGMYWIDSSGKQDVLRQYSSATKEWVEVPTVYVKIKINAPYLTGVGEGISMYDTVTVSGLAVDTSVESSPRLRNEVKALNGDKIVYGCAEDYIIVEGFIRKADPTLLSTNTAKFIRSVPDLDYICESQNRIWGCKYGPKNQSVLVGETLNEIRACKLGDFKNWNNFMGLSTDSYVMSIGTPGPWTGAVTQRGYPVFFKENCIHRVTGSTPDSYQLSTIQAAGVQDGSWRSIALMDETIFYKSVKDVMAFDGNMPYAISENLGNVQYDDARAGALDTKYYISMKTGISTWNLFVYNKRTGNWLREDDLQVKQFATCYNELWMIDEVKNKLIAENGTDISLGTSNITTAEENEPGWRGEFGLNGAEYSADGSRKETRGSHYLSRFDLRMSLAADHTAYLDIQYDSDGHWIEMGEIHGTGLRTIVLPVVPRRCDHLRFRLRGKGNFRLFSISRILEVGGDG